MTREKLIERLRFEADVLRRDRTVPRDWLDVHPPEVTWGELHVYGRLFKAAADALDEAREGER